MDGDALYSIGQLARRTRLTVKTVRFYSDRGIVRPAGRSPGGYRRYDVDAVARLELVRTLRDLGLDLATIQRIVNQEAGLPEVADAHADALAVQIRLLRLRRAVLTAVAKRGSTPEELEIMHKLATLSEQERQHLIDDFLDSAFGGRDAESGFAAVRQSMTPELPDDPEPRQVEAWIELAGLMQDPDFRASVRRLAEQQADEQAQHRGAGPHAGPVVALRDHVGPALRAGIGPTSTQGGAIMAAAVADYARSLDRPYAVPPEAADVVPRDDAADGVLAGGARVETGDDGRPGAAGDARREEEPVRRRLLAWLEAANDPRREQYLRNLAVINGWAAPESLTPLREWSTRALRAHVQ